MLIGNKSDLSSKYRRVTYEQGSYFAHQNRCLFFETSARKNSGIQDAFETLIKLYMNNNTNYLKNNNISSKSFENVKLNKKSLLKKNHKDCVIM